MVNLASCLRDLVSIPYSTIKIKLKSVKRSLILLFQFLIVRLKFVNNNITGDNVAFQFLIVRLKFESNGYRSVYRLFQFLIVRLKFCPFQQIPLSPLFQFLIVRLKLLQ